MRSKARSTSRGQKRLDNDAAVRLSERERLRLLLSDEMLARIPAGDAAEVDRELRAIRKARHAARQ